MSILLSLLGNKNVWIILIVVALGGGVWFKVHSLEGEVAKAKQELAEQVQVDAALTTNNAALKQNLDLALSVNEQNAKLAASLQADQDAAAQAMQKLSTDLTTARRSIESEKSKLAASKQPGAAVPQNIIDAVTTIQDSRVQQAAVNKTLEALP